MSSCLIETPLVQDVALPVPCPTATERVLHVINGEHYAGAERVQDLLAGALTPLGFDVAQVCLKPGRFAALRQGQAVPLYNLPMRSRFDLRPALQLARLVRQGGFRLLHSHGVRAAMVAGLASKLAGVPLVHHLHSPTDHDSTHPWQDRMNAWAERLGAQRASALIAVSNSVGQYARRQGLRAGKGCGHPQRRAGAAAHPGPRRRQEGLDPGHDRLVSAPQGDRGLAPAMALLRWRGVNVRLRAVGDFESPDYDHRVKQLVWDLGLEAAIDWVGFQRDIDGQLAQMDLLVLPSLFGEGLPMVVLEAMSAGLPVVAADVEGIPEAVRDGREGLLVAPGDPQELAGVIGRIVAGQFPWPALRAACLARHAERFSEVRMAADIAAVYRRVLATKN